MNSGTTLNRNTIHYHTNSGRTLVYQVDDVSDYGLKLKQFPSRTETLITETYYAEEHVLSRPETSKIIPPNLCHQLPTTMEERMNSCLHSPSKVSNKVSTKESRESANMQYHTSQQKSSYNDPIMKGQTDYDFYNYEKDFKDAESLSDGVDETFAISEEFADVLEETDSVFEELGDDVIEDTCDISDEKVQRIVGIVSRHWNSGYGNPENDNGGMRCETPTQLYRERTAGASTNPHAPIDYSHYEVFDNSGFQLPSIFKNRPEPVPFENLKLESQETDKTTAKHVGCSSTPPIENDHSTTAVTPLFLEPKPNASESNNSVLVNMIQDYVNMVMQASRELNQSTIEETPQEIVSGFLNRSDLKENDNKLDDGDRRGMETFHRHIEKPEIESERIESEMDENHKRTGTFINQNLGSSENLENTESGSESDCSSHCSTIVFQPVAPRKSSVEKWESATLKNELVNNFHEDETQFFRGSDQDTNLKKYCAEEVEDPDEEVEEANAENVINDFDERVFNKSATPLTENVAVIPRHQHLDKIDFEVENPQNNVIEACHVKNDDFTKETKSDEQVSRITDGKPTPSKNYNSDFSDPITTFRDITVPTDNLKLNEIDCNFISSSIFPEIYSLDYAVPSPPNAGPSNQISKPENSNDFSYQEKRKRNDSNEVSFTSQIDAFNRKSEESMHEIINGEDLSMESAIDVNLESVNNIQENQNEEINNQHSDLICSVLENSECHSNLSYQQPVGSCINDKINSIDSIYYEPEDRMSLDQKDEEEPEANSEFKETSESNTETLSDPTEIQSCCDLSSFVEEWLNDLICKLEEETVTAFSVNLVENVPVSHVAGSSLSSINMQQEVDRTEEVSDVVEKLLENMCRSVNQEFVSEETPVPVLTVFKDTKENVEIILDVMDCLLSQIDRLTDVEFDKEGHDSVDRDAGNQLRSTSCDLKKDENIYEEELAVIECLLESLTDFVNQEDTINHSDSVTPSIPEKVHLVEIMETVMDFLNFLVNEASSNVDNDDVDGAMEWMLDNLNCSMHQEDAIDHVEEIASTVSIDEEKVMEDVTKFLLDKTEITSALFDDSNDINERLGSIISSDNCVLDKEEDMKEKVASVVDWLLENTTESATVDSIENESIILDVMDFLLNEKANSEPVVDMFASIDRSVDVREMPDVGFTEEQSMVHEDISSNSSDVTDLIQNHQVVKNVVEFLLENTSCANSVNQLEDTIGNVSGKMESILSERNFVTNLVENTEGDVSDVVEKLLDTVSQTNEELVGNRCAPTTGCVYEETVCVSELVERSNVLAERNQEETDQANQTLGIVDCLLDAVLLEIEKNDQKLIDYVNSYLDTGGETSSASEVEMQDILEIMLNAVNDMVSQEPPDNSIPSSSKPVLLVSNEKTVNHSSQEVYNFVQCLLDAVSNASESFNVEDREEIQKIANNQESAQLVEEELDFPKIVLKVVENLKSSVIEQLDEADARTSAIVPLTVEELVENILNTENVDLEDCLEHLREDSPCFVIEDDSDLSRSNVFAEVLEIHQNESSDSGNEETEDTFLNSAADVQEILVDIIDELILLQNDMDNGQEVNVQNAEFFDLSNVSNTETFDDSGFYDVGTEEHGKSLLGLNEIVSETALIDNADSFCLETRRKREIDENAPSDRIPVFNDLKCPNDEEILRVDYNSNDVEQTSVKGIGTISAEMGDHILEYIDNLVKLAIGSAMGDAVGLLSGMYTNQKVESHPNYSHVEPSIFFTPESTIVKSENQDTGEMTETHFEKAIFELRIVAENDVKVGIDEGANLVFRQHEKNFEIVLEDKYKSEQTENDPSHGEFETTCDALKPLDYNHKKASSPHPNTDSYAPSTSVLQDSPTTNCIMSSKTENVLHPLPCNISSDTRDAICKTSDDRDDTKGSKTNNLNEAETSKHSEKESSTPTPDFGTDQLVMSLHTKHQNEPDLVQGLDNCSGNIVPTNSSLKLPVETSSSSLTSLEQPSTSLVLKEVSHFFATACVVAFAFVSPSESSNPSFNPDIIEDISKYFSSEPANEEDKN